MMKEMMKNYLLIDFGYVLGRKEKIENMKKDQAYQDSLADGKANVIKNEDKNEKPLLIEDSTNNDDSYNNDTEVIHLVENANLSLIEREENSLASDSKVSMSDLDLLNDLAKRFRC